MKINCSYCGKETKKHPYEIHHTANPCCSIACARAFRAAQAAEWHLNAWGYLARSVDGERILQHREIVERALGRPLERSEIVHHKDKDTTNNDLSNLEVITYNEHGRIHATGRWRIAYTDEQLLEILASRDRGVPVKAIAEQYGIHPATIARLRNGSYRRAVWERYHQSLRDARE